MTARLRSKLKWPWMSAQYLHLEPEADVLRTLEANSLTDANPKVIWVTNVLDRLVQRNADVFIEAKVKGHEAKAWTVHVVGEAVNLFFCFVSPLTKKIYIGESYLDVIEDDGQLGMVLGHELSHLACDHVTDFCFMESAKEMALLLAGVVGGWFWVSKLVSVGVTRGGFLDHSEPLGTGDGGQETDDERQGTSDDQRGSALGPWARGARYFMVTGIASLGFAVAVNLAWILPFRRRLEEEADGVGIRLAAQACLDVTTVPAHWDRLALLTSASVVPSWRSTHPSFDDRKVATTSLIPTAKEIGRQSQCDGENGKGIFSLSGRRPHLEPPWLRLGDLNINQS